MRYKDFIQLIEEIAPTREYEDIDNSGIQIYTGREEINKVLVCLDINQDVIEEAVNKNADMIITHHPLIFNPAYVIDNNDFPGRYINELIKNNISVYSAHLSFDFATKGNNFYMMQLLNLLIRDACSKEEGYYGELPEAMNFSEACEYVEDCLDLPKNYIRCVDGGKEKILKIGLCTGAGGDYIFKAAREGCDLFITGDLKLHEAQYAKAVGMSVIDAGHFGTEKNFVENMSHQIYAKSAEKGLTADVIITEANTNPYIL
ncbi:MAG: Nif3-like dinuclear metal center hexameric protein [Eubacteriales bacterium]|nr:Nif3-like dinuclear metal center hexameric protein [Eubacteriales bacterium]